MKQKIFYISFSILLLLVFTSVGFTKKIEKDITAKIDKKEQTVQKTGVNSKESATKSDTQTKTTPNENKSKFMTEFPPMTTSTTAGEQINWQVISSGGNRGTSTNYILSGTIGQTAVDFGTSTNFQLNAGFWQKFGSGGCCVGFRGNIDGSSNDLIDISDLVFLIAFMFQGGASPLCYEEADVDASTLIDISDLVALVAFMFKGGAAPSAC